MGAAFIAIQGAQRLVEIVRRGFFSVSENQGLVSRARKQGLVRGHIRVMAGRKMLTRLPDPHEIDVGLGDPVSDLLKVGAGPLTANYF